MSSLVDDTTELAAADRRTRTRTRRDKNPRQPHSWIVFGAALLATVLQPSGRFLFDAVGYWNAAGSLIGSPTAPPEGFWDLRGVVSAVVYLPAQALTGALGPDVAGFAVLVQNSLVIAALAAFVVPALLRPWAEPGLLARWVMAGAVAFVARGFAPYPLVDLYAAAAVLVAAHLLTKRSWPALMSAGLLLGCAFNIRPAYLVPLVLAGAVIMVHHRFRALIVAGGVLAALVPQMVYLAATHHTFGLTPVASSGLVGIQTSFASYTVRYDTAITSPMPQQFFCSPEMTSRIGEPPLTIGSLAETMLTNLPHSGVFALEKLGAALHWPLSIPYLVPDPGVNALVAVLVTSLTVIGCTRLLSLPVRADRPRVARPLIAALVVGTAATLVSAATEARFALFIVLVGSVGLGALMERPPAPRARRADLWLTFAALAITVTLLAMGWIGLSHPAAPGGVTVQTCAELAQ